MASYFELMGTVPHTVWHREPGDSDWDLINEVTTEPLQATFPLLTIRMNRREAVPDFFHSGTKPIVSMQFKNLAEHFKVCAEFLPVKVLNHRGESVRAEPFWFMHMLEDIDCIDFEKTDYETVSDRPNSLLRRIRNLCFRTEAIEPRSIFRPRRYLQIFVTGPVSDEIVHERLNVTTTPLTNVILG